ncbi:hypothetical protein [Paraburkholderia pallida]|uniref:Uncharacterized protein n=1 Tax=Paraburkholderia pallida TaxID=2547399 RepID=A0A4V1AYV9_9BURK|nr:hypothetical protein [Paraburkholderia pallida]QBQ97132.1 hypothetical protein E1956_08060 [Paraburkholderia pallida]
MARSRPTRAATVPGAGKMFALRAIGLVILARWLHSMGDMNFLPALRGMASSPVACLNLVFLFLLIVLPGAKARVERPFHPLPQWLRQALRIFGVLGCLFALWSIGLFVWDAGWRSAVQAIESTNGWLVVAPALYASVVWICRPRALWRTNVAARRFAIGRYAVSIDAATRTTIVWLESRKVGQYDARELSVRGPAGIEPAAATPRSAPADARADAPAADATPAEPGAVAQTASPAPGAPTISATAVEPAASDVPAAPAPPRHAAPARTAGRYPRIELLWDSPAAAGHNRQTVMRVRLVTEGDRVAARALDTALKQV